MANKRNTATGWHRPLTAPIRLRDGHVVETLAQAAGLLTQRLPKARQLKPIWQRTAALLMDAHATGNADDLDHATGQLRRALDAEGWAAN
jgi:hypothetical protein